jgi:hypothetical protein
MGEPDKMNKTSLRDLRHKQLESMCQRRSTVFPNGDKVRWPTHGKKEELVGRLLGDPVLAVQEQPADKGEKQRSGEDVPWPVEVKVMIVEEMARLLRVCSRAISI